MNVEVKLIVNEGNDWESNEVISRVTTFNGATWEYTNCMTLERWWMEWIATLGIVRWTTVTAITRAAMRSVKRNVAWNVKYMIRDVRSINIEMGTVNSGSDDIANTAQFLYGT